MTRIPDDDVRAVLHQYRRNSCGGTARAIAVALVEARRKIHQLMGTVPSVDDLASEPRGEAEATITFGTPEGA